MRFQNTIVALAGALAAMAVSALVYAQSTDQNQAAAEHVAAIKQNLMKSEKNLKQYQWTETMAVSYKGEEKSSKTMSCMYDSDGKVVKTTTSAPPTDEKKRGLRGRVAEKKEGEISTYMKSAVALIKSYVPPNPAKIQACKDAGNMSLTVIDPGKRAKIDFKDYEKKGDDLGVEIDLTTNEILGLTISSYLSDTKDTVSLNVVMASLADGTQYPATITLNAPSEETAVTIKNSGYEKKQS